MLLNWLRAPKLLSQAGILGLNSRNFNFIQKYNARELYPMVDDKLETKKIALNAGLKTPPLYGVIRYNHEVKHFHQLLGDYADFVVKPAQGSGGNGILVVSGREGEQYLKASGAVLLRSQMERYLANILSGLHSLGGRLDTAMVEYRIQPDPLFEAMSYQGVPDIRILVFQGFPVMGMLRLSTAESDGKANLHQGAIGVGLDLADGRPLQAVQYNHLIDKHPDTGLSLNQFQVPDWDELLSIACRCYEATGLGYLGVDIVVDRDKGPLILEMNARPGLNIQIANRRGLVPRLRQVESWLDTNDLPESARRIELAREWFS
ncbi:MAG: alpha-L-glutamate ligase-like protein [Opitutales bacterium]|nr:alpha-L-glutamate ligase-like protein [Opitutales bacterium]